MNEFGEFTQIQQPVTGIANTGLYNPYQNINTPQSMFASNLLAQTPQFNNPVHYENSASDNYNGELASIISRANARNYQPPARSPQELQNNLNIYGNFGIPVPQINTGGGYYPRDYTSYNPFAQEARQKEYKTAYEAKLEMESSIWKDVSRAVNKSLKREITDEQLSDLYDPLTQEVIEKRMLVRREKPLVLTLIINNKVIINTGSNKVSEEKVDPFIELRKQEELFRLAMTIGIPNQNEITRCNNLAATQNFFRSQIPQDASLYEFFRDSGLAYTNLKMQEIRKQQKDLSQLYNRNQFGQLVVANTKPGCYANNIDRTGFIPAAAITDYINTDIDDIEITLPENLRTTQFKRKEAFFNLAMGKISENRGHQYG